MKFLFRADASLTIGAGHIVRCGALASWLIERGHAVRFLLSKDFAQRGRDILSKLVNLEAEIYDGEGDAFSDTIKYASSWADWVILDGYHFDEHWLSKLEQVPASVIIIDDYSHLQKYPVSILVNPNTRNVMGLYEGKISDDCQLFGGPEYAFLRSPFRSEFPFRRKPKPPYRLLVTGGGGRTDKFIKAVLTDLKQTNLTFELLVLASKNLEPSLIRNESGLHEVKFVGEFADIRDLISWADLAITAGGSSCWEFASCGCPAIVIPLVENQRFVVDTMVDSGAAISPGWLEQLSAGDICKSLEQVFGPTEKFSEMSQNGQRLVDGLGVERIGTLLENHGSHE